MFHLVKKYDSADEGEREEGNKKIRFLLLNKEDKLTKRLMSKVGYGTFCC